MAQIDLKGFLQALAAFIAAQAGIAFPATPSQSGTPSELWLYDLIEDDSSLSAGSPTPASVIVPYDGQTPYVPVDRPSIQIRTIGVPGKDASAMARAEKLHGTLLDANRVPIRKLDLPTTPPATFRVIGFTDIRGPSQIGRDDKGRILIVTNFDAPFVALS